MVVISLALSPLLLLLFLLLSAGGASRAQRRRGAIKANGQIDKSAGRAERTERRTGSCWKCLFECAGKSVASFVQVASATSELGARETVLLARWSERVSNWIE